MALTIADVRTRDRIAPIPLVTIATLSGAVLRVSDRVVDVGGLTYDSLLLESSSIGESVNWSGRGSLNADHTLVLRNESVVMSGVSYASLIKAHEAHPFTGATVTISYACTGEGQTTETETPFVGAAEAPQQITMESLSLRCSSMPHYKAKSFEQAVLEEGTFATARADDYGRVFPTIFGAVPSVEVVRAYWGGVTTTSAEMTAASTTIYALSTSSFSASGSLVIDSERISYTGKTATAFTGITRATGGTVATMHILGAKIIQYLADYYGVAADHEIHSIGAASGEYDGEGVKIVAPTLANVSYGGKVRARIASQGLFAVGESVAVADTIGVSSAAQDWTQMFRAERVKFWAAGTTGSFSFIFPSNAPAATVEAVHIVVKFTVTIIVMPTSAVWQLKQGSTVIAYVDSSGIHYSYSSPRDVSYGSTWQASQSWSVINAGGGDGSGVEFDLYSAEEYCTIPAATVTKTGTAAISGASIRTVTLDRLWVDVNGMKSDNAIYGTVGSMIERPDYVMKKWITYALGFTAADIDSASFDAAGTWYAANSYALAVPITEKVDPEDVLYRMAYESRSIVWYRAGKWYLIVIPDTAPASIKTISRKNLAGEGASFACGYTSLEDVVNVLSVRYARNLGPSGDAWLGAVTRESVVAGYQRQADVVELEYVRLPAMASSVGDLMLKRKKRTYETVGIPVFWGDTDLKIGDTIMISDMGFWEDLKFFIFSCAREGIERATFIAVAWWA